MFVMTDFSDQKVWRLLLTVGMRGFDALFFNRKTRQCVPYSTREWVCPEADLLKYVENAVYEDTLITEGYDTTVLLRPRAALLVPPQMVDPEDPDDLRRALDVADASEQKDVWCEPLAEALAIYSTPRGLKDFLGRTFLTEDVHYILVPMAGHFQRQAVTEGGEKMWVHLSETVLDIVAFRDGKLLYAGARYCAMGMDAVYHILYVWNALGLDSSRGGLHISGKEQYRRQVMSPLRRHINYVSLTVSASAVSEALAQGVSLSAALTLLK